MYDYVVECQQSSFDVWHERHVLRQAVRHLEADNFAMQDNNDDLLNAVQKLLQDVQAANATKVHPSSLLLHANPELVSRRAFCDDGRNALVSASD